MYLGRFPSSQKMSENVKVAFLPIVWCVCVLRLCLCVFCRNFRGKEFLKAGATIRSISSDFFSSMGTTEGHRDVI